MNRAFFIAALIVAMITPTGSRARATDRGSDLRISLTTMPEPLRQGIPVQLTLDVRDRRNTRVRDLPLVHERPIHLIIVPSDLSELTHLHPIQVERGLYRTTHTFPHGGRYLVYADLKSPAGVPMVVPFTLTIQGDTVPVASRLIARTGGDTAAAGGLRAIRTSPRRISSGVPVELGVALTDVRTGGPVGGLEPYLGSMAHVIIVSSDGGQFLHAHAMEGEGRAGGDTHGGHEMHAAQAGAHHSGSTMLAVHTMFPRTGVYRIWMQVQREGRVITLPFTVNVSE